MIGSPVASLDTPALLVDLDRFEHNLSHCVAGLAGRVALRPHLKTAKSPAVALRLLSSGAQGICVAKLGEAEVMLAAGVPDIHMTSEFVGAVKFQRFIHLFSAYPDRRLSIVIDSSEVAQGLQAALAAAECGPIRVLIDVNIGHDRCGVAPERASHLANEIRGCDRLHIVGVQGYEGHLQHVREHDERRRLCHQALAQLITVAESLRSEGHTVEVVTTGGTGTAMFCAEYPGVTEVQPGSFAFMDADYLDTKGLGYVSALTVVATVISCPTQQRVIVDAGLKALSDDSGPAGLVGVPGWIYHEVGDEHGRLTSARPDPPRLPVGTRVELTPSHVDPTINLHDVIYAHRKGLIEEVWAISARGKSQ
ncbi:MAG: DSD1 family PLP-dependent enzyme [Candidatus Dormibacteria bacterium]